LHRLLLGPRLDVLEFVLADAGMLLRMAIVLEPKNRLPR
jgi:hypothetical protein